MVNPVILNSFGKAMRVTPSLPQRGRQPKGSIPLTPFSPIPEENFASTSREPSHILWMPQREWRQRLPQPKRTPGQFSHELYNVKFWKNSLPRCASERP